MPESRKPLPKLALGALGVVFGDIGTSPLYAVKQAVTELPAIAHNPHDILGVLSLVLWSLILVVCVKYVTFVTRADHDGEGGTMALLGLLRGHGAAKIGLGAMTLIVLFGSALLYGDGIVTPAISVLSAVEGLNVATTTFQHMIVPIAIAILAALFLFQRFGTGRVGSLFGPVLCLWFVVIAALGVSGLVAHPESLRAFDPRLGIAFLTGHGWKGYAVLGAVVLCVSGVEALFADLGHFGRRPIVFAWYCVVLPALMLNYLGQSGQLIASPDAADNPFFSLVPHWGLYPMVALSTVATVIASQALISGTFSLTQQAINMGFCPRLAVIHTSTEQSGQIYMPSVNFMLMAGCVALVLGFRSSDALGAAYGLAVTGTMTSTTIAFHAVMRKVWGWTAWRAYPLTALFLTVDLAFLGANVAKIFSGAWVPLVVALFVFGTFVLWTDMHRAFTVALRQFAMPVADFLRDMTRWGERTEGTAVFITHEHDEVPLVGRNEWLLRHVRQERVLLLTIDTTRSPYVAPEHRLHIERGEQGLFTGKMCFGFMEPIDIPGALRGSDIPELAQDCDGMMFFLPRPFPTEQGSLAARLRRQAYVVLSRIALTPIEFFAIPPHQTVSVGVEITF